MSRNIENMLGFNKLINWYLNDDIVTSNDYYLNDIFSKNISLNFNFLNIKPKKKLKKKLIKIPKHSINLMNKKDRDLIALFKKLSNEVKANKDFFHEFLIHGSFSTSDYSKGWSDLDTFVIIKNNILKDHNELKKLKIFILKIKKYLYKIDPIQHHGFIFCTQNFLNNYQSFMLPINVLLESKSLFEENKLIVHENINLKFPKSHLKSINILFYNAYKKGVLEHHKYNNKFLLDNYKDINTMYQMKYFLSIVMTLPTYYLHSKGLPTYKKYSFDIVKKKFLSQWNIVEDATMIRNLWSKNEYHPYKGNDIPFWLKKCLGDNYFKRAYLLSKEMISK